MAMEPGLDWAIAVRSSISSSSIQCSSFTKRSRIKGIMTKPPPKVQALSLKVERNSCQYLFFLSNRIGLLFSDTFEQRGSFRTGAVPCRRKTFVGRCNSNCAALQLPYFGRACSHHGTAVPICIADILQVSASHP